MATRHKRNLEIDDDDESCVFLFVLRLAAATIALTRSYVHGSLR